MTYDLRIFSYTCNQLFPAPGETLLTSFTVLDLICSAVQSSVIHKHPQFLNLHRAELPPEWWSWHAFVLHILSFEPVRSFVAAWVNISACIDITLASAFYTVNPILDPWQLNLTVWQGPYRWFVCLVTKTYADFQSIKKTLISYVPRTHLCLYN